MAFLNMLLKNLPDDGSSSVSESEPKGDRKKTALKGEDEDEEEEEGEEEKQDFTQDQDSENCSSASSTVMSESIPNWADYTEVDPWADELKPPFKLAECEDFICDEDEAEGVLSDRMINSNLSFVSPCPLLQNYSLNKLQLSEKNLWNISKIADYRYLQYVDLSRNNLRVIAPLGNLPFLMHLDVSYNNLAFTLQFTAPLNLTYVNFSHNEVSFIDDLTDFWSLVKLDLSYNQISRIEGLRNLRYLRVLDISFNNIKRFENLNYLRLTHLYIQNNKISDFEEGEGYGTKTLQCLQFVNFDNNELESLALFEDSPSLQNVSLKGNQIQEIFDIENLKSSVSLKELNFVDNPVTTWPEYRGMVICTIPSLVILDGIPVSLGEKILAKNTFDPDARFVAARNHSLLTIMEHLNNPVIDPYIPPVDKQPLPIVVLVGPVASEKGYLTRYIAEKFPETVSLGVCHTSRPKSIEEIDGYHYHFVDKDKMNELVHSGAFVAYSEILGENIGLERSEIIKAFLKQRLCITHMDLIGARSIYDRGINPYLILTIPQSEELHLQRLLEKHYISQTCRKEECQNKIKEAEVPQSTIENIEAMFTESFMKKITERERQKMKEKEEYEREHANTTEFIASMILDAIQRNIILSELEKQEKNENLRNETINYIAHMITDSMFEESDPDTNTETAATKQQKEKPHLRKNTFYYVQNIIDDSFPKVLQTKNAGEEKEEEDYEENPVEFIKSILKDSFLKNITARQKKADGQKTKEYIENFVMDSFLKFFAEKYKKGPCHCLSEESVSIIEEKPGSPEDEGTEEIEETRRGTFQFIESLFSDKVKKKVEEAPNPVEVQNPHTSLELEKELISQLPMDEKDYIAMGAVFTDSFLIGTAERKPGRSIVDSLIDSMGRETMPQLPRETQKHLLSMLTDSALRHIRPSERDYKPPKKKKTCLECDYAKLRIKLSIESRNAYFKLCEQKKDFFSAILYTDNRNEACRLLSEIVKEVYRRVSHEPPIFSLAHEKFKASIPERLSFYMSEINKHHHMYEEEKINEHDCQK